MLKSRRGEENRQNEIESTKIHDTTPIQLQLVKHEFLYTEN